ncbi:MAG: DNA polymerase III [Treponema sp.]|jgi:DNA polymerase-3 subunit gamma/tau|nr:DNA polymerase III [Treponema sp.]
MFENVLGQDASGRLEEDLERGQLAPAMLFTGPPASGKGTAALELARVLSCGEESGGGSAAGFSGRGAWNCACPSCVRHRYLVHQDLLLLGPRRFSAEIAAAGAGLLRESESPSARVFFIRSIRKLLGRFSPVLWEDDPGFGKLGVLIQSIEEALDELARLREENGEHPGLEKLCSSLIKDALKLEESGMAETIPIAHIRRAAYWSRLAPSGRVKFILMENAGRMQEGARNSLLKILEEPPERAVIVLTTVSRGTILPTVQSRLRHYRFTQRDETTQSEVIRRIFRGVPGPSVPAYLDSFLPVSDEKLAAAAAFFAVSLARLSAVALRRKGAPLSSPLVALGKRASAAAGSGAGDTRELVEGVLERTGNFGGRSFSRFLAVLLDLVSAAAREDGVNSPVWIAYNEMWREASGRAAEAVGVWNQTPALALELMARGLYLAMTDGAAVHTA